ncbi:ribonuclease HIII [Chlamydia pecorum PV3056/3]|uniref:ribonuclease HIII n=1 Tax=Chlamydia pecorum TaxID=85991 RepID=UPI0003AE18CC|nr:ribonuclease HIII [Chlamydia pecorum]AGW37794.1 ribonuclease HIII [Chlamydia pecorum PV3056/3]
MSAPFVTTLSLESQKRLKQTLEKKNFVFSYPQYTIFQAKSPTVCCTLYSSGKLVVQGKGSQEFIEFVLEPEVLHVISSHTLEQNLRPRIGVDESGKGDFFGPLCIAGVYAPDKRILQELYKTKIQDSKTLRDTTILSLAKTIRSLCTYDVMTLYPEKYNELYGKFRNLNALLAWGHATVIDNLAPRPAQEVFAISDQFASSEQLLLEALKKKNSEILLIQKTKAEADIVVAAASILAREAFITSMKKLEALYKVQLPKGVSVRVLETGKHIVHSYGKEALRKLCKMHFKTYAEVCGSH